MNQQPETPFNDIEGAREYTNLLLEAAQEAQGEVEAEIARVTDPRLARRKQALQLVSHKLIKLSSHIVTIRQILNDLRTLRRLLLEEREATPQNLVEPNIASPGITSR
jgi:hypothetical protein